MVSVIGLMLAVLLAAMPHAPRSLAAAAEAPSARRTKTAAAHPKPSPTPMPLPPNLTIPAYPPGPPTFHDGETLYYEGTWMGAPAASARVIVGHSRAHPEWWRGEMWITSSAVVDLVYRMRDYFREDFWRDTYRPDNIYIEQHENKRFDTWHTTFDQPDHLVVATKHSRTGKVTIREFSGGDPLGPFSGAMMALSQPLKPGDDLTFDVFSGGNRYVFAFKVIDRERITTTLGTFNTLKIEPSVIWLSQGSFRSQARQTTIWVTDDGYFGSIYCDLVKIEAAGSHDAKASAPAGNPGQAGGTDDTPAKPDGAVPPEAPGRP
jgi:hypothetical protein